RKNGFNGCIFVDNCYGEFVEKIEPTDVGADICVGSLIKNAGGGIAPTGGYIVGKDKYIQAIGRRFTAPSIGLEVGSYEQGYRYFYQGLFMAPHTVGQAVKVSLLIGMAMTELGYKNYPSIDKVPHDITRCIEFGDKNKMVNFIREVQFASPVDSYVTCEPWDMPGYDDKIIMAAGTFVSGSSIELSADGPVKEPYLAYFQGGLTYEHGKYALSRILDKI
ncbi:MAG: methionine gamma-lyase family protein, partial [Candidatus Coproplasma sp.]